MCRLNPERYAESVIDEINKKIEERSEDTIEDLNEKLLELKAQRRRLVRGMINEWVNNVSNADDLVVEVTNKYDMKLYNTKSKERPIHYILDKQRNLVYNLDKELDDRVVDAVYDNRGSIGAQLYDLMLCEVERLKL